MKKIIFALIIFTSISQGILAQDTTKRLSTNPLKLSFGLDAGAPLGNNSKIYSFVVGGDLQLEYSLTQNFRLTGSGGVDVHINKGGLVNTIYYAPFLGGLRYYFGNSIYISEQAGYSLALTKGLDGLFTNVAGIGFKLSQNSDILLAYKSLFAKGDGSNFNTFAFRIAYVFGK